MKLSLFFFTPDETVFLLHSPLLELRVDHPVGESLPADPDSLEDAVAGQLVHDQRGVDVPRLLVGVGHHAAATDNSAIELIRLEFKGAKCLVGRAVKEQLKKSVLSG